MPLTRRPYGTRTLYGGGPQVPGGPWPQGANMNLSQVLASINSPPAQVNTYPNNYSPAEPPPPTQPPPPAMQIAMGLPQPLEQIPWSSIDIPVGQPPPTLAGGTPPPGQGTSGPGGLFSTILPPGSIPPVPTPILVEEPPTLDDFPWSSIDIPIGTPPPPPFGGDPVPGEPWKRKRTWVKFEPTQEPTAMGALGGMSWVGEDIRGQAAPAEPTQQGAEALSLPSAQQQRPVDPTTWVDSWQEGQRDLAIEEGIETEFWRYYVDTYGVDPMTNEPTTVEELNDQRKRLDEERTQTAVQEKHAKDAVKAGPGSVEWATYEAIYGEAPLGAMSEVELSAYAVAEGPDSLAWRLYAQTYKIHPNGQQLWGSDYDRYGVPNPGVGPGRTI